MAVAGGDASPGGSLREGLLPKANSAAAISLPWRLAWTLVLWLAILGIGVALAMLGPTLDELATQLALPTAAAGTIFTFRAFGYFLGAVWCGEVLHRFTNAAAVFVGPLFIACGGAVAIPRMSSYPVVCVLFVFQGISMGMLDTAGNMLMLDLWRGSRFQNGFEHFFHFLFGLGAFIAPMVVRSLLANGWDAMVAWPIVGLSLLPSLLGLVVLSFAPQPRAEQEEASPGGESRRAPKMALDVVTLTGAFLFVYVGIEVGFGGYIDVFSVKWLGASKVQGATLTSIFWGALCAGRAIAALATPFVHHARYLAVHLLLSMVAAAALGAATLTPGEAVPGSEVWRDGVEFSTALFGLGLAPLFPGALLVAEELLGGPLAARDTGRMVGAAAAGEMALPLLLGVTFAASARTFPWAVLAMCVSSSAIFLSNSASVLAAPQPHGGAGK